jgi:enhancing lycopene biosynthesis protein 2
MKRFAVVISGCGVQDGAEIHESVMAMLAIDLAGCRYQFFAPDIVQHKVVNHYTGKEVVEQRNVLVESARIARGDVKPLSELRAADYDALLIPGGFGAALNLSTFAVEGANMEVNGELAKAIVDFNSAKKAIGAMCISPVIVAKVLKRSNLTIGKDEETASIIEKFGASHIVTEEGEVVADLDTKVFTTPCYMLNASVKDIFTSAKSLVSEMLKAM